MTMVFESLMNTRFRCAARIGSLIPPRDPLKRGACHTATFREIVPPSRGVQPILAGF